MMSLNDFLSCEVPLWKRFRLLAVLVMVIIALPGVGRGADQEKPINQQDAMTVRQSVEVVTLLMEYVQVEIIEGSTGDNGKLLFSLAAQVQRNTEALHTAITAKNPSRQDLYKLFDRIDGKVAELVKATVELSPKRPALERAVERVRLQNDELHFLLSAGDETKARKSQVLVRLARSMKITADKFAIAADYWLTNRVGRDSFVDAVKQFSGRCATFEKVADKGDFDQCKKDFSTLTEDWEEVVRGFLRLPAGEDFHIARLGFRVDQYHLRVFELLNMPGERPQLTITL